MNKSGGIECLTWTWGIAALAAVFTAAALWVLGGWTFMQGAFMGVLCLLILGALLTLMMCRGASGKVPAGSADVGGSTSSAPAATPKPAATPAPAADTSAADAAKAKADSAATKAKSDAAATKSKADAAAAKTQADAADAKVQADAAAAKAKADAADAKSKADVDAAKVQAAAASAAPVAAAVVTEGDGNRPAALDGPRAGGADDLKRIKGIGPKMEDLCNDLGFYHFDQIAAWSADEVRWVDQNLKGFKGRVSRDTWVDQAGLLAAGGETEFSKKVDDGSVY